MKTAEVFNKIIKSSSHIFELASVCYLEMISSDKIYKQAENQDEYASIVKNSFQDNFDAVLFKDLINVNKTAFNAEKETQHFEVTSDRQKNIQCYIFLIIKQRFYLILECDKNISEEHIKLINVIISYLKIYIENTKNDSCENSNKDIEESQYKKELLNLRQTQAKLFPKFEDVEGYKINSAYLPTELMSGNFIDGFSVAPGVYQIIACDLSEWGPSAAIAGATIRTIIRSEIVKRMSPSSMIQYLDTKIKKILPSLTHNYFITIYQVDASLNRVLLSSLGTISTLFYNKNKNKVIALNETTAGKQFANRNFYKDLSLSLDEGDSLLFYSRNIDKIQVDNSSDLYDLDKLKNTFIENIHDSDVGIVHSIINSIYEFIDYQSLPYDIILINISKK